MRRKQQTSKAVVVATGLYLLVVLASLLIMLTTVDDTPMSGIVLILVTMPWSLLLTRIQGLLSFDSMMLNTLFLVAGGLLNSVILYKLFSFIMNKFKHKKDSLVGNE